MLDKLNEALDRNYAAHFAFLDHLFPFTWKG